MKELRKGLVLIGLLLMTFPAYSFEYTHDGNTLEYTELRTENGVTYVSVQKVIGNLPTGSLVIPGRFDHEGKTYEVITVAEFGFRGCKSLTSVTLPNTLDSILEQGFYACDKMISIKLNEGLKMLGDRALCNDSALVGTLVIPATVDTIADFAFAKCMQLSAIKFLKDTPAKTGGRDVFMQTKYYVPIIIPDGTYDAYSAYCYLQKRLDEEKTDTIYPYQDITFDPQTLGTSFYDGTLRYTNIADDEVKVSGYVPRTVPLALEIPSSVSVAGKQYNVTEVGKSVFEEKSRDIQITSVVFPKTMRTIGDRAFRMCRYLKEVTLNEGLEYLGNRAFCKDSLLSHITIPSTVTFMGNYSIGDIPNLQWVELLPTTPPSFDSYPLAGVPVAAKCDVIVPCGTKEAYAAISEYGRRVVDPCLSFNSGLYTYTPLPWGGLRVDGLANKNNVPETIDIPAQVALGSLSLDVVKVRQNAFGYLGIKSVVVPSTVDTIENNAFRSCTQLTSVTLNEGLKYIGNRAFCQDAALTGVVIPSTAAFVGDYAFHTDGGGQLTWVELLGSTPPTFEGSFAFGPSASLKVIVPCGTGDVYRTADFYNANTRVFDRCNGTTSDGVLTYTTTSDSEMSVTGYVAGAINGALSIPAEVAVGLHKYAVTAVKDYVFNEKADIRITSLAMPNTMRSIGANAFRSCTEMTSLHLNEGLRTIGNRAFCNDSALVSLIVPSTVNSMGSYAFGVCKGLKTIYLLNPIPAKREVYNGIESDPFPQLTAGGTLYYMCGSKSAYDEKWKSVLNNWDRIDNCQLDIYHHNYPNAADNLLTEYRGSTIDKILYHRIFTSGQWETLYLPFEVESVTLYDTDDNLDYEIKPNINGNGHFWLLEQEGTEDGYPKFVKTNKVKGHTPYLIQFINTWYDDKVVTFHSAANPEIETTFSIQWGNASAMYGNNTLMPQSVGSVYLLETDGSSFYGTSETRTLYPFECYVTEGSGEPVGQSRRFAIRYREAVPTSNDGVPRIDGSEMLCTISGNTLTVQTDGEAVSVYSVNGTLLYSFPQGTASATMDLKPGYYIVTTQYGSQKIVL